MSWPPKWLPDHAVVGIGVFLLVGALVVATKKLYEQRRVNPEVLKKGASLVKRAAKHAAKSQQSRNPLMALEEATTGQAYLQVARSLAPDLDLEKSTGLPMDEFSEQIDELESRNRDRLMKLSPQLSALLTNPIRRPRNRQASPESTTRPPIPGGSSGDHMFTSFSTSVGQ